jgi:hypothetical protein
MKTNIHFFTISRSVLLRMRNSSAESSRENRNNFMFNIFFLENRTVYDILWKKCYAAGQA